ncbi:MAG: hypothetical protein ACFFDR_14745, partial [Candidatus Thorarchaeota archaeon]
EFQIPYFGTDSSRNQVNTLVAKRRRNVSYTKKELKNYLKRLEKDKSGLSSFTFEYRSGHTAFHSRTRIIMTPEKIVLSKIPKGIPVDKDEEKAAKVRNMAFSEDALLNFIKELIDRKIWDMENCTERALPDTALLSFMIRDGDNLLFEQKVWENCRNDDKRTKELIRSLAAILPRDWPPP